MARLCLGEFIYPSHTIPVVDIHTGQGSQRVGMAKDICAISPAAHKIFTRANEIVGYGLDRICFDGPPEKLSDTTITQPALVTTELALRAAHKEFHKIGDEYVPLVAMGHSVGELVALCAAGVLTQEEAIMLADARGKCMGKITGGGMTVLIAKDMIFDDGVVEQINAICGESGIDIALLNSDVQIVLSGNRSHLAEAVKAVTSFFPTSRIKSLSLPISIASHSREMKPAADEFSQILEQVTFRRPVVPVGLCATGTLSTDPDEIKQEFLNQMIQTVQWRRLVATVVRSRLTRFHEYGPKDVLTGLMANISPLTHAQSITDVATVQFVRIPV